MSNKSKRSRRTGKTAKPPKPYPEFPLCPASNGRWQKKIKGKLHYFGRWGRVVDGEMTRIDDGDGWQAALEIYKAQVDDISSGTATQGPEQARRAVDCRRTLQSLPHREVQPTPLDARAQDDTAELCGVRPDMRSDRGGVRGEYASRGVETRRLQPATRDSAGQP